MRPLAVAAVLAILHVTLAGVILHEQPKPSKHGVMKALRKYASDPETKDAACFACTLIVDGVQGSIRQNATDEEIDKLVSQLCVGLQIEQPHICDYLPQAFGSEIYFVLAQSVLTPDEICGAFITDCGTATDVLQPMWNMSIPGNKPAVKPWPTVPDGKPTLRVLHLSDIHIDRYYADGSEADCQMPQYLSLFALCCRDFPPTRNQREIKEIKQPSGTWGMPYACDLPYKTFDSAMKHIANTEKLDYILITGDKEAHDPWDYSKDRTLSNLDNITAALLKYFPDTPIYESTGNHEGVPSDAMAPHRMKEYEERGPQWLYSNFVKNWGNWLPSTVSEDIQYRASYVIRPYPGLKMISLNTIYCSVINFYLYIDQVDPDGTLEWLIDELLDSEAKGEKVHIFGHIPAGDDYCLKGWAKNFYDIVLRFENTIAAQFYGHTHYDHFQVYYENSDPNGRPVHFNWIAPSLTTYDYLNPAYRIYTIDGNYEGSSYTVIDAETYYGDVTEANANNKEPDWKLEYRTKATYKMPDLSPASWNDLINRLDQDDALFDKFHLFYSRNDKYEPNCRDDCKKNYICALKAAKSHVPEQFCPP